MFSLFPHLKHAEESGGAPSALWVLSFLEPPSRQWEYFRYLFSMPHSGRMISPCVSNRRVSLNGFPVASYLLDCSVNFVQYSSDTTALQLLFTGLDVPLPLLAYCVARALSASPVPSICQYFCSIYHTLLRRSAPERGGEVRPQPQSLARALRAAATKSASRSLRTYYTSI
jgi:hypothetical protein